MTTRSESLLERAMKRMPGGVNSPVRAFKSVGGIPRFIERAKGASLFDADGKEYIDYVLSWGPAILGHAPDRVVSACQEALARGSSFGAPTELEVQLAELVIERVPGLELMRLVNSGTEACMSAIRVARGVTGREKIIKFDGCYHGHADSFLIAAGSGALTLGTPNSPGVTTGTARDTLLAQFNNLDSVSALFEAHGFEIAGVIVEPICGNTGCIPPKAGFLRDLKRLCDQHGSAFIMDEVMTGFRVARGGAAEIYDVTPDLYCFGKVIGGGFPLAAYGGTEKYMRQVAPDGPIYQAGTLSGNPVAVTAGIETLKALTPKAYDDLESLGQQFETGLAGIIQKGSYPLCHNRVGSMFGLFFTPGPIESHLDVNKCDIPRFNKFFHHMLEEGIYLAASQYEAGFLSVCHTPALIDQTLSKIETCLRRVYS
ncbi:MAG: glutamate-1-semialdehyde 2,1-aminomutase [Myxococcota bacterium]|nr:glutamate-1-semialdehyde 2,1-aminomutase [Myxococcota bacterium]